MVVTAYQLHHQKRHHYVIFFPLAALRNFIDFELCRMLVLHFFFPTCVIEEIFLFFCLLLKEVTFAIGAAFVWAIKTFVVCDYVNQQL